MRRGRGQKLFVSNTDINGTIMTFKYLACITGVMDKKNDFIVQPCVSQNTELPL
jgi:hypothetical protein